MPDSSSPINWLDKLSDWGWSAFWATVFAAFGWIFYMERKIGSILGMVAALKLHVSETYVKKTDMDSLKAEISSDMRDMQSRNDASFRELKDGNEQILNLLMGQKIGTRRR
jgi:hypothetical protein